MPSPPLPGLEGFGLVLERYRFVDEAFTAADVTVPRRDLGISAAGKAPMSPSDQSCVSTQAEENECKVMVWHTATRVTSVEASSICQNIMAEVLLEARRAEQSVQPTALDLGEPPEEGTGDPSGECDGRRSSDFFLAAAASFAREEAPAAASSFVQEETPTAAFSFSREEVPLSSMFDSSLSSSSSFHESGLLFDVVPAGRRAYHQPAVIPRLDFSAVQGRFAGPVAKDIQYDMAHEAMLSPYEESYSSEFFKPTDPCACAVNLQCGQYWRLL